MTRKLTALLSSSKSQIVWRKFKRNTASLVGAAIVLLLCVVAISAPFLAPYDPKIPMQFPSLVKPNLQHPLGTDKLGRDVFSYIVWGGRISLSVGIGATIIEVFIALIIGGFAGYYGGQVDNLLMRFTDIIMTLPTIVLLIVAVSMFEVRSSFVMMIVMSVISWPWMARTIRGEFLHLRETSYVEAARSIGASDFRIIFRHITPNALSPIIVLATIDLAWFILYQATLTFLGLGDPTEVSWGIMINLGRKYIRSAWWVSTFPGLAIFFSTLGFNLLGDGLRDALDVKTRL